MSDSHTSFNANNFAAGAGLLLHAGTSAVAGAIISERDRMQAQADDAATCNALASWERLVDDLTHENLTLRRALDERDAEMMIAEAELATLRQRCSDAGVA